MKKSRHNCRTNYKIYKNLKGIFHIGNNVDSLYDLADLVMCDFGDGIFDAVYLQKPFIFLRKNELNNEENYFLKNPLHFFTLIFSFGGRLVILNKN